jgi:hypothetical protein
MFEMQFLYEVAACVTCALLAALARFTNQQGSVAISSGENTNHYTYYQD